MSLSRTGYRSFGAILAAGAALLAAPAAPVRAQAEPPTLTTLIPKGTLVFGAVDSGWIWDTTAGVREIPEVQQALGSVQAKLGISFDSDIKPWAGMVAGGLASVQGGQPNGFCLIEIKDPVTFGSFLLKLKGIGGHVGGGLSMSEKQYAGTVYEEIALKASKPGPGGGPMLVDVAPVNGWLVVGIGNGAIEKMLNTYSRNSPSIDSVAAWHTALSSLPSDRVSLFGYDFGALLGSGMVPPQAMGAAVDRSKFVLVSALSATPDSLHSDYYVVPETTAARTYFQRSAAAVPPVQGAFLQQVPGAASVGLVSNPGYWIRNGIQNSMAMAGPGARNLQKAQPILDILYSFTGDAGAGITFRPDIGLGLAVGAQAATPAAAARAARVIAARLKAQGLPITSSGTTYSMDLSAMTVKGFPLTPVVSARGRWLLISTSSAWIRPGTPGLALPSDAGKSYAAGAGNFKWLDGVNTVIGNTPIGAQPQGHAIQSLITGFGLDNATWSGHAEMDPQGAWAHGSYTITGWDYKAAVSNTAQTLANVLRSTRRAVTPRTTDRRLAPALPREAAVTR